MKQTTGNYFKTSKYSSLKSPAGENIPNFMTSYYRGTFSRAGRPKILVEGEESKASLLEKIHQQNLEANRDEKMTDKMKKTITSSFKNVQKSFNKCATLNDIRTAGWSLCDQDFRSITGGIGGSQHTFVKGINAFTNDAAMFSTAGFSHTDRNLTALRYAKDKESRPQLFHYRDIYNKPMTANLDDKEQVFKCAKSMNYQSRLYYSNCLDQKGRSQIKLKDRDPAGFQDNKI